MTKNNKYLKSNKKIEKIVDNGFSLSYNKLVFNASIAQWWSTRLLTDRLWVRAPPLEPIRRGGGIGRRTGLKIPRSLPIVPVRPRSPAPL